MSAPQTKRKVMGRINISGNASSGDLNASSTSRNIVHSTRVTTSSPVPSSQSGPRKAKVDPSTIIGPTNESINGRPSFVHSNTYDSHASSVRSPLQHSTMQGAASPLPTTTSTSANTFARQVRARQATRSPSPSLASPSPRPGPSTYNDAPSISTRPRVRPTSILPTQRDAIQAVRSATPIAAKVAVNADVTIKGNAAHFADSAVRSPALQSRDVRDVSRSPSPTIVRAALNRRISHGSNISASGASSVSSPQASEAASRRQSAYFEASVKRPSLSSLRVNGAARITSDHSSTAAKSTTGLDSPLDLISPVAQEQSSSTSHTYFTSPSTLNTAQSTSAALLSPGTELDAEAVEAKTNRKILDLEITNKSLLAINSGLEVTKLKQAREIRDLRRRLREGRGLGDRLGLHSVDAGDVGLTSATEDEDELSEEENEEAPLNAELEEAHQRCKLLIDAMVSQARHAIISTHELERGAARNRVLHPAELEEIVINHEKEEDGDDDEDDHGLNTDVGEISQSISGSTQQSSADW